MFANGALALCSFPTASGVLAAAEGDANNLTMEIVQVKILQHRKTSEQVIEYYIHREGTDPRLDEWVPATRFVSNSSNEAEVEEETAPSLASTAQALANNSNYKRLHLDESGGREKKIWHHGGGHGGAHTMVRNIDRVHLGNHLIDCWYYSPYPYAEEDQVKTLYICQETFKYARSPQVFARHVQRLRAEHGPEPLPPPGPLIYHEDGYISVYRVEGAREQLYCQNLCLLGKLFLDHKTLYFDPSHFYFFVLVDHPSKQFVGYFSKEKESTEDFNLACILTLPPFQRRGYGKFIISLSYELSKREGKQQTPEKPLSDLGKLSYRAYWSCILLQVLLEACRKGERPPSVGEISKQTGIKLEDTVSTLQALGCVKYFKRCFVLSVSLPQIQALYKPFEDKNFTAAFCKPQCLLL